MAVFGFDQSEANSIRMNSTYHPYSSSIASSASSSSSSVFSADSVSSQISISSVSSSSSHVVWGTEDTGSYFPSENDTPHHAGSTYTSDVTKVDPGCDASAVNHIDSAVIANLRQHPRRTKPLAQHGQEQGIATTECPRPPPSLVRQCDRKVNFVDNLVGKLLTNSTISENRAKFILPLKTLLHRS